MSRPVRLFLPMTGVQQGRPFPSSDGNDTEYRRFNPTDVDILAFSLVNSVWNKRPNEEIGGEGDPYLLRWHIRKDHELGNIYLHKMLRNDDERALHDHPWENTSIILSGEIEEVLAGGKWPGQETYRPGPSRILLPGMIVSRGAEDPHLLKIHKGPVWTLFITGKKVRDWGFHTRNGWIPWEDFPDPISGITPREKKARQAGAA